MLDAEEVAAAWDVRPVTVRRWAREGRLPGVVRTPGGALRFTRAALPPVEGGEAG
jgi:predicted site-specific integrase-resolvase